MFTRKDLLVLVAAVVLLLLIPGAAGAQGSMTPCETCQAEWGLACPCLEEQPEPEPVGNIDPELERLEQVLREFTVDDVAYVIYEDGSGTVVSGSEAIGFCIHSGICYDPPLAPPASGDVAGSAVAPFDTIFDVEVTTWMVYSDGCGTATNGDEVMDFYTKDHYPLHLPLTLK